MKQRATQSKYRDKYVKELYDYFSEPPYKMVNGQAVPTDYKSLNNFACKIGVVRQTLQEWAKEFPEFGEMYAMAKQFQEQYITVNGMKGIVSVPFAQFIAINHLDMRTKAKDEAPETIVQQNNSPAAKLSDEELDQAIQKYQEKIAAKAVKAKS